MCFPGDQKYNEELSTSICRQRIWRKRGHVQTRGSPADKKISFKNTCRSMCFAPQNHTKLVEDKVSI